MEDIGENPSNVTTRRQYTERKTNVPRYYSWVFLLIIQHVSHWLVHTAPFGCTISGSWVLQQIFLAQRSASLRGTMNQPLWKYCGYPCVVLLVSGLTSAISASWYSQAVALPWTTRTWAVKLWLQLRKWFVCSMWFLQLSSIFSCLRTSTLFQASDPVQWESSTETRPWSSYMREDHELVTLKVTKCHYQKYLQDYNSNSSSLQVNTLAHDKIPQTVRYWFFYLWN